MWCYASTCGTRSLLYGSLELRVVASARDKNPTDSDGNDVADRTDTSELWIKLIITRMPDTVDAFLLQHITTRLVAEFPPQVERCLEVLSEEDLWWRPHELSNAVGNLVLHVAGSNRHFLEHVIGGAPGVRDRDAEFAARGGTTKADVLKVWTDVTARVDAVLRTLTPERLVQPTSDRNKPVAEVLLHVTHHNAFHIGQIVWITKLRRPGTIHELLRPGQAARR